MSLSSVLKRATAISADFTPEIRCYHAAALIIEMALSALSSKSLLDKQEIEEKYGYYKEGKLC